jgi:hypothetical protein
MTVNYLRPGDDLLQTPDSNVSTPITKRVRGGSDYTAPIKHISGMTLDTDRFPGNAIGKANDDITVNYYYSPAETADLILHYYNEGGWEKVCAFVSAKTEDGEEIYSDETPGTQMKPDSSLGKGWYSLTIKGKGNVQNVTARFSDGSGAGKDETEYQVSREVWIKDGSVTRTGDLTVVYVRNGGVVLGVDSFTGKVGEEYTTIGKNFDNLRISGSTENVAGTYTESPVYVIYSYDELTIVVKPVMKVVVALGISSLLTLTAAAVLGIIYRKKFA